MSAMEFREGKDTLFVRLFNSVEKTSAIPDVLCCVFVVYVILRMTTEEIGNFVFYIVMFSMFRPFDIDNEGEKCADTVSQSNLADSDSLAIKLSPDSNGNPFPKAELIDNSQFESSVYTDSINRVAKLTRKPVISDSLEPLSDRVLGSTPMTVLLLFRSSFNVENGQTQTQFQSEICRAQIRHSELLSSLSLELRAQIFDLCFSEDDVGVRVGAFEDIRFRDEKHHLNHRKRCILSSISLELELKHEQKLAYNQLHPQLQHCLTALDPNVDAESDWEPSEGTGSEDTGSEKKMGLVLTLGGRGSLGTGSSFGSGETAKAFRRPSEPLRTSEVNRDSFGPGGSADTFRSLAKLRSSSEVNSDRFGPDGSAGAFWLPSETLRTSEVSSCVCLLTYHGS
ncbi:hypothetical protein LXL04_011042 [Taraxacum kok-saghyz]